MNFNIAVLKGDGIGPEIVNEAIKSLNAIGKKFNHQLPKYTYRTVLECVRNRSRILREFASYLPQSIIIQIMVGDYTGCQFCQSG